jgi:hypothetical protein
MDTRKMQPGLNQIAAEFKIGRKYSADRVRAYECELDSSGKPVRKLRYVTSWYRMFHEERLRTQFLPKLTDSARKGRRYPFLLTQGSLMDKTDVSFRHHPPRTASDIRFAPRKADTRFGETWLAVVLSETQYRLLP